MGERELLVGSKVDHIVFKSLHVQYKNSIYMEAMQFENILK